MSLSFERVLDVIDLKQPGGVIVSVGGQIPKQLGHETPSSVGTHPGHVSCVYRPCGEPQQVLGHARPSGIDQPAWQELTSLDDMKAFIDKVGYPVLVRPSYVLSGAAMNVCHNEEQLTRFLEMAREVSKEYPVVVSQFMQETKEVEFDAVAQNGEVVEYAISEHIEYAGVNSGDATFGVPGLSTCISEPCVPSRKSVAALPVS